MSRKRAYSESCGRRLSTNSSTITLYRSQSDSQLSRIDREKTFEDSDSLFHNKDLLSNVLTALGSIRPMNEDVHSCVEMHSCEPEQTDSLYEWTWDGNNSEQIKEYVKKNSTTPIFPSESKIQSEDFNIHVESEMRSEPLNRSFMSRFNPFKESVTNQERRRCSVMSQQSNAQKYLENTSLGRGSGISMCQLSSEDMELLQNTSIADLIRAVEGTQNKTNVSPSTPLLGEYKENSKLKIRTGERRGSLRPVHDYTTIFMSPKTTDANREPTLVSRPLPSSMTAPKRITKRIRSTSSSIPTVQEHYPTNESSPMLYRTMSLRPTPLARGNDVNTGALPQMPMITVQAPNVTKRNLLWHPEYQEASTLQNKIRRNRADSN